MNVKLDPDVFKKLKKLDVRVRKRFRERIAIFAHDPQNPQLNNHPLSKQFEGYWSIDITNDYRAIYEEIQGEDEMIAYFIAIGTHEELYRKKKNVS